MKFFDLFPAPKYLNLSEAGVSFEDRSIRYISLNPLRYGEFQFPEADALKKLRQSFAFVSAAIPEGKSYLFNTKVESATYHDLLDAVAFTIEENAPVKLANSVHSFEYLGEPEAGKGTQVSVAVLPLESAKFYRDIFKAAELTPVSFDLRSEAVARALIASDDKRMHLVIDMGETKTGLYLVDNGLVRFSTTHSIVLGLPNSSEALNSLKDEVKKVFLFAKDKKIEHVTLTGPGAADDSFVANLLADVSTPYSVGDVWINTPFFKKSLPDMPFAESIKYAAAIGSALPSRHAYV